MEQILTVMGMDQKDLTICPGINASVIMKVVAGDGTSQQQVDGVTLAAVAVVVARYSSKSVSTKIADSIYIVYM